jgi:hypothetical protein
MTYEQIFAGQLALSQAIKHLCNRSMSMHSDAFGDRPAVVVVVSSDQSELPERTSYWMPRDDRDAIVVIQRKYLDLEAEFQQKKSKRRARRCA